MLPTRPLECVPAGQPAHTATDVAPVALELVPGGHAAQLAPGMAFHDPGGHNEQFVAPRDVVEDPAGQRLHPAAPRAGA